MMLRKAVYLLAFFLISVSAGAQINIYLGGNLEGNYSWIRGEEPTFHPGFGGGFSFVYWEYEYWFVKTGIDYYHKTSSVLNYPDIYDVPVVHPDDKVRISYTENAIGLPVSFYVRPYESGANALLLTGSLEMIVVASLKADTEEFGEMILEGSSERNWTKSNLGFGVGYQRQIDRHAYFNLVASFNMDIRATPSYNSFTLTLEYIFGAY
ncbi:MAG: hypothetical protein ABFS28_11945 [Bacteroidota bacterium]